MQDKPHGIAVMRKRQMHLSIRSKPQQRKELHWLRHLFAIVPANPYTSADLDWRDKRSRSTLEAADPSCRPAITSRVERIEDYDTIFLGFPIWWYVAPAIVNTFLESYDLTGKTIVLFATSGGSGMGKTASILRASAPGAKIVDGGVLNNVSDTKLEKLAARYL